MDWTKSTNIVAFYDGYNSTERDSHCKIDFKCHYSLGVYGSLCVEGHGKQNIPIWVKDRRGYIEGRQQQTNAGTDRQY